jgi:N-acetylmuramoyl-L-alanine amidase
MTGFVADFSGAEVRVSPNFGPRRGFSRADMIILHYTGMETGAGAEAWLCNSSSEVSSHYLVHEDGQVVQMVREADRAWHAGRGSWHGLTDINSHSIGIEIVNQGSLAGHPPFPDVQIASVIRLCRDISARLDVPKERILAHSDVAPGRKIDPGPAFPWSILHAAGVGHLPEPVAVPDIGTLGLGDHGDTVERLQSMLQLYGYGVEITGAFDAATKSVVEAFQLHFRQRLTDGAADAETQGLLAALVAGLAPLTLR